MYDYCFSWQVTILPFMERQNTYDQFDLSKLALDQENLRGLAAVISEYQCPSTPGNARLARIEFLDERPGIDLGVTDYSHVRSPAVNRWPCWGIWHDKRSLTDPDWPEELSLAVATRLVGNNLNPARDFGLSRTAIVSEEARGQGPWPILRWATGHSGSVQFPPASFHQDSANVLLGDGSVRAYSPNSAGWYSNDEYVKFIYHGCW